jgi:hypothetical protein
LVEGGQTSFAVQLEGPDAMSIFLETLKELGTV